MYTIVELQARVSRLERQNRLLIIIGCVMSGLALVAATKHPDSVITAGQIRTQRITLIDNLGKPLEDTSGVNGVEIREYLPHNVIQR